MNQKSLKDCSDKEIADLFVETINDIRKTKDQYGEIVIIISGGKVKHINITKPYFT